MIGAGSVARCACGVALVAAASLLMLGCGSPPVEIGAGQAAPRGTAAQPAPSSTTTASSTSPPTTKGAPPSAEEVEARIEEQKDRLLIGDELKPCVSDRLARGTDTSRPAGSSGEDGVAEVVESCRRQKVFGEAFADSIGERAGRELSATESECLAGGLADLTPDEVDLVLASGVNPQVPGGAELIERVTSGCGVEVDR